MLSGCRAIAYKLWPQVDWNPLVREFLVHGLLRRESLAILRDIIVQRVELPTEYAGPFLPEVAEETPVLQFANLIPRIATVELERPYTGQQAGTGTRCRNRRTLS
ncbi:hypothetical protein SAMN04487913_115100 [Arthrobacter sp. ok362]|nr:hypothetical protein SAMN04487913_115100 [Arthrobacter sp. ok362]